MEDPYSISWEALEYEHFEKTPDWYWGLGVVALIAAGVSIFFGNMLFAIVIILGAISLGLYGAKTPSMKRFSISSRGVMIGKVLYPYSTLDSFWVHSHEEERPLLFIKSKKLLMPLLVIPLAGVNPRDVHERLLEEIPQEEHGESFAEHLFRWLRF